MTEHDNIAIKTAEIAATTRALIAEDAGINKVAIYSIGGAGVEIAWALLASGLEVILVEHDPSDHERVAQFLAPYLTANSDRTSPAICHILGQDADLTTADLVIYVGGDDTSAAPHIFAHFQQHLPAGMVVGLLTSQMKIVHEASRYVGHDRCLGIHLSAPLEGGHILEMTAPNDSTAALMGSRLAVAMSKLPIIYAPELGVIGPRLWARYLEAADTIFMDGATPWDVDDAMTSFGFALGPYESEDLSGLDHGAMLRRHFKQQNDGRRHIPLMDRMLELGKLGRKTGAGWYRYPGGGGKVEDPIVADLAIEESYFAGRTRCDYTQQEIITRMTLALINEATAIYTDASYPLSNLDPDHLDVIMVLGLGFPRDHHGLIAYADKVGAASLVAQLQPLALEDPVVWQVSPLLAECAARDVSIYAAMHQRFMAKG